MADGVPEDNPLTNQILKYGFNRPETLEALTPPEDGAPPHY